MSKMDKTFFPIDKLIGSLGMLLDSWEATRRVESMRATGRVKDVRATRPTRANAWESRVASRGLIYMSKQCVHGKFAAHGPLQIMNAKLAGRGRRPARSV